MNIRVDLNYAIKDGTEVVFRSPVDCSQVTGLKVYYMENGITASKEFAFADAHGNNVGDIPHLFAQNVVVKVILDVTSGMAFVQNADTNAYIERTFVKTVNGIAPDESGNVEVEGGGTVTDEQIAAAMEEYMAENPVEVSNVVKTVNGTAPDESGNVVVDVSEKMDAANPVGSGSFSMNRKGGTIVGSNSHAEGTYNTASGANSHAEGGETTASGTNSHAEGFRTTASGVNAHVEGEGSVAQWRNQHVQGSYNIVDTGATDYARGAYVHIVGNGTSGAERSNAHTIDWNGVGWFAGGLQVGGNAQGDDAKNVLLEGDAVPVPFFDLAALGLGAITPDGGKVRISVDTTEIREALDKGSIKVGFNFNMGATIYGTAVINPMHVEAMGAYQCNFIGTGTDDFVVRLVVDANGVSAWATTMSTEDAVSATHSWNGTVLTITSASGTSSADLKGEKGDQGEKGAKGDKGDQGIQGEKGETGAAGSNGADGKDGANGTSVTVKSVSESTADGGSNVVTFSDGKTVTIKNGSKGSTGSKGDKGDTGAAGKDGKDYSFDPTVYGLPVLELTGDTSPIAVSKDNKVTLSYVYGEHSGTCTLKGQGATSYKMAKAFIDAGKAGKFNYTINFDTAFEAAEGWGAQQKYCLKANWIDHSHSRNVVSAKLWGMIVKSRSTANANLSGLVNGGAIDGFPIVIMLNGEFHGLYTFNIPKDGWMMGLVEDATKTQAIVGANDHLTATQFKGESAGNDADFELEFVSDEDNADWVTPSLNRLINACINTTGSDLDTTVAQYLDWDSAIDYYIWVVVCKGTDMVDKNYLLSTFDGTKWHFTAYDMDSTYGLNWDGSGLSRAVSNCNFDECAATHRVYELIKRFKTNTLKARYNELRKNVLSETRICQIFENFAWAMPSPVLLEDVKLYPTILGSSVNGIDQICRWVRQRLEACDEWINALPAQETPEEPEEPVEMVNLVPTSTDTDGSIYNSTGYKDNVRLSSSGSVSGTAQPGSVVTGFIPCTYTDIIRIKGATWLTEDTDTHWYVHFYNSSKTTVYNMTAIGYANGNFAKASVVYDAETGVTTFDFSGIANDALKTGVYIRLNAKGSGANLIVTVNQEIV